MRVALATVPPVTVTVKEPSERILSLLLADRTLTGPEWDEIEAHEAFAPQAERLIACLKKSTPLIIS